jgi:general secretion pathway protein K
MEAQVRPAARESERGIALLTVLWVATLLGVIGATLLSTTRTQTRLAHNLIAAAQARASADAGVSLAVWTLLGGSTLASRQDGEPKRFTLRDGHVWVSIQDAGGMISANQAPPELLRAAFRTVGADDSLAVGLADRVIDWRDPDTRRRPAGAEDDEYISAGLSYLPRNAPFRDIDELRLIYGMTPALFERVAPLLTVASRRSRIDPLTAPREVLLALPGARTDEVEEFLAARAIATAPADGRGMRLPSVPPSIARHVGGGAASNSFAVRSRGVAPDGVTFALEALVRLQGREIPPYQVLLWRQDDASSVSGQP